MGSWNYDGIGSALLLLVFLLPCASARSFGIVAAPYRADWAHRVSAAGAMACMHVNHRDASLVKELANLSPGFNISCDIVWTETTEAGKLMCTACFRGVRP